MPSRAILPPAPERVRTRRASAAALSLVEQSPAHDTRGVNSVLDGTLGLEQQLISSSTNGPMRPTVLDVTDPPATADQAVAMLKAATTLRKSASSRGSAAPVVPKLPKAPRKGDSKPKAKAKPKVAKVEAKPGKFKAPTVLLPAAAAAAQVQGAIDPTAAPLRYTHSGKLSHARKKAADHIKRPPNAFILFRSHCCAPAAVRAMSAQDAALPATPSPQQLVDLGITDHRHISRIVSHLWKSLGPEDKAYWATQGQLAKEEHMRIYPDYKYKPVHAGHADVRRRKTTVGDMAAEKAGCEKVALALLGSVDLAPRALEDEAGESGALARYKEGLPKDHPRVEPPRVPQASTSHAIEPLPQYESLSVAQSLSHFSLGQKRRGSDRSSREQYDLEGQEHHSTAKRLRRAPGADPLGRPLTNEFQNLLYVSTAPLEPPAALAPHMPLQYMVDTRLPPLSRPGQLDVTFPARYASGPGPLEFDRRPQYAFAPLGGQSGFVPPPVLTTVTRSRPHLEPVLAPSHAVFEGMRRRGTLNRSLAGGDLMLISPIHPGSFGTPRKFSLARWDLGSTPTTSSAQPPLSAGSLSAYEFESDFMRVVQRGGGESTELMTKLSNARRDSLVDPAPQTAKAKDEFIYLSREQARDPTLVEAILQTGFGVTYDHSEGR